MRIVKTIVLFLIFNTYSLLSQDLNYVTTMDIYLLPFNYEFKVEVNTIEKLKDRFFYYLKVNEGFNEDINSEEKIEFLLKKITPNLKRKNEPLKTHTLRMYVVIYYRDLTKKEICFDISGNFFMDDIWYNRNDRFIKLFLSYFPKKNHGYKNKRG